MYVHMCVRLYFNGDFDKKLTKHTLKCCKATRSFFFFVIGFEVNNLTEIHCIYV